MKYIYLILIITSFNAQAQKYVGFKGKSNILTFNYVIGNSYFNQSNKPVTQYRTIATGIQNKLNQKFEFTNEKVRSKKTSIGLSIQYFQGYCDIKHLKLVAIDDSASASLKLISLTDTGAYGSTHTSKISFGIYSRRYMPKFGGFAPNGAYIEYGLNFHLITIANDAKMYYSRSYYTLPDSIIQNPIGKSYISFKIGIGKQKVIKIKSHYYVFNIAANFNLAITNPNKNSGITYFNAYKQYLQVYHRQTDMLNLKFGFGYLF